MCTDMRCVVLQTLGFNRNPVFSLPMTKWRTTSCPDHLLQNPLPQNSLQSQTSFKKVWRNMKSYESSKFTLEWNCKITKTMRNSQGQVDTWHPRLSLGFQRLSGPAAAEVVWPHHENPMTRSPAPWTRGVKPETDLYRACEVRHVPRRSSRLSHVNLDVSSWHSSHISGRPGTKAL